MECRFSEIRCKEVINIKNGCRLGYPCDMTINIAANCVTSLIIPGPARFFGLFGRGDDIVVPWASIRKIGEDIILVECEFDRPIRKGWFWG
jgi:YlmC/YmxH family sporulation protein